MSENLLKTGTFSIVCGENIYGKYFPKYKNKLLKITQHCDRHSEGKYSGIIKKIPNYEKYYSIPDEISYLLTPNETFYKYLQEILDEENLKIFGKNLYCYYVSCAGNKELLDTINDLNYPDRKKIWNSYDNIIQFSFHIMSALYFLHQNKLCHLDIKPENIMVDTTKFQFKLIDFGFCSQEPFEEYVHDVKGTAGYFPKFVRSEKITRFLPQIEANDYVKKNGMIPIIRNRKLVYKIDSFCLGRVIYMLLYLYQEFKTPSCFFLNKRKIKKIKSFTNDLLMSDVYQRLTITQVLQKYFPNKIN